MQNKNLFLFAACTLVLLGFVFSFWPLAFLGVALAVVAGRWISAVLLAVLLDVVYGVPVGRLHVLYAPFTLAAVLGALLRARVASAMREYVLTDRL